MSAIRAHSDGQGFAPEAPQPDPVGSLYVGDVMHARMRPKKHKFSYRVFSFLLDIDRLEELRQASSLIRYNKPGVFSFHDKDHGRRDGSALRPWVESHLVEAGLEAAGHRIEMLCFPRVLGYVFNPLTIYFCHRADGALGAVLYQVKNTFGDQHGYLMPIPEGEVAPHRHACRKGFYVSPFIQMNMRYCFVLKPPAEDFDLSIRDEDDDGLLLLATQSLKRRPLTTLNLVKSFFSCPLLTLKVMGGIHWEALLIWGKGAKFNRRPTPPAHDVTFVPIKAIQKTSETPAL